MTTLLDAATATGVSATEGNVKTFLGNIRTFIADMLGTDSTDTSAALSLLGALMHSSAPKSAAYTVVAADKGKILDFSGAGGITLSMAPAATLGDGFVFGVNNGTAGTITFDPNLSELVNGTTTYLMQAGETVLVYCNGTAFLLFGKAPASIVESINDKKGVLTVGSIQTHTAGTKKIPINDSFISTVSTTLVEVDNALIMQNGTYRVSITGQRDGFERGATGYLQIYKNGAAFGTLRSFPTPSIGTFTEDLAFTAGDTMQVFMRTTSADFQMNFEKWSLGVAVLPVVPPVMRLDVGIR